MPSKLISTSAISPAHREEDGAGREAEAPGSCLVDARLVALARLQAAVAGGEILQLARGEHDGLAALAVDRPSKRGLARFADGADLVRGDGHGRTAVENVDIPVAGEAFALEHLHRRSA